MQVYHTALLRCKDCDEYLDDLRELSGSRMTTVELATPFEELYTPRFFDLASARDNARCSQCDCANDIAEGLREWSRGTPVVVCLHCWLNCNRPLDDAIRTATKKALNL